MVSLKYIHLQNFCGYKDAYFDFTDGDKVKNLALFFGPNGAGKSSILKAVNFLSAPWRYESRDMTMLLKKNIFSENYDPSYTEYYSNAKETMSIEGVFKTDYGDKKVKFECDPEKARKVINEELSWKEVGVKINELPKDKIDYAYLVDADSPINMHKFSLIKTAEDKFLDIANAVYGYECKLEKIVEETDSSTGELYEFFNDFVIYKPEPNVNVHFKSMSAGEQKIATMIASLCRPSNFDEYDIFLIDNIEMHVYMKRHNMLIDKLFEHLSDKQILATTHSPILVGCEINDNIKIPAYVDNKYLYNVEEYHKEKNV